MKKPVLIFTLMLFVPVVVTWPWIGRPTWSHWRLQRAKQALLQRIQIFTDTQYPAAVRQACVLIRAELPPENHQEFDSLANVLIPRVTTDTAEIILRTLANWHSRYAHPRDEQSPAIVYLQSMYDQMRLFKTRRAIITTIMVWPDLITTQQDIDLDMAKFTKTIQSSNR